MSRSNRRSRSGSAPVALLGGPRVGPRVDVVDAHGARVGAEQAGDHRQRRGLARAVRSDDAEERPGAHVERDAVDRRVVAELLHESLDREHAGCVGARCGPGDAQRALLARRGLARRRDHHDGLVAGRERGCLGGDDRGLDVGCRGAGLLGRDDGQHERRAGVVVGVGGCRVDRRIGIRDAGLGELGPRDLDPCGVGQGLVERDLIVGGRDRCVGVGLDDRLDGHDFGDVVGGRRAPRRLGLGGAGGSDRGHGGGLGARTRRRRRRLRDGVVGDGGRGDRRGRACGCGARGSLLRGLVDLGCRGGGRRGVDASGVAVGSVAVGSVVAVLRPARSAAVVSVVRDAATRCVCRLVVAAAAARLRAAGVPDAAVERAALADFAASPRALDAFDDAAREAAVRFDSAVSSGWSGVAWRAWAWRLPWRWPRPWLQCCAVRGACVRAWRRSRHPTRRIRHRRPSTRRSPSPTRTWRRTTSWSRASWPPTSACAASGRPSALPRHPRECSMSAAGAVLPGRFAEPRGARGAVDDPRTADTPVPVPSGASSSKSERETEVTQTTYQSRPSEPSCDVARRRGSCAFPERRITIPLRPPTLLRRLAGAPDIL